MKKLKKIINTAKAVRAVTTGQCGDDMVELNKQQIADFFDTMSDVSISYIKPVTKAIGMAATIVEEFGETTLKAVQKFEAMDQRAQKRFDEWENKHKSLIEYFEEEEKRIDEEYEKERKDLIKDIEAEIK